MVNRISIQIEGRVQGVGFRPFVYQLAQRYQLSGWVFNNAEGVVLEIQGEKIEAFLVALVDEKPEAAQINKILTKQKVPIKESEFIIRESEKRVDCRIELPPDRKICDRCLGELYTPTNRRYRDALINCSQCGPRFTMIKELPYDREQTTMVDFVKCEKCEEEYKNPSNHRFHTESICCPECEPQLLLWDGINKRRDHRVDAIQKLRYKLQEEQIVAIKGVGGYHLATLIKKELIEKLRERKKRDLRPLAIMVKDLKTAKKYGEVSDEEAKLLTSHQAPIVLVKKNLDFALGDVLAPDTERIGLMLPYMGIHHLLFEEGLEALVMTSGNLSGEPIDYEDEKALSHLEGMADYVLFHKRRIEIGIDDSVTCVIGGKEQIIRRARGYTPQPITLTYLKEQLQLAPISGLACGGDMKNTFCILREDQAYLSQHLGSIDTINGLAFYKKSIQHFKKILDCDIQWIAYDLHPHYITTQYAKEFKEKFLIGIQHHKAHLASCITENHLMDPVIGVIYDGTGYGEDGQIWGGEFFVGDLKGLERVGHLQYVKMLGGEQAIREPWRMAYSYLMHLEEALGIDLSARRHKLYNQFAKIALEEGEQLLAISWKKSLFTPYTSSMGRLFDGVAALLGKGEEIGYEAQAAIWLEHQVKDLTQESYPYDMAKEESGKWVIGFERMFKALIRDQSKGEKVSTLAAKFHQTIICMTVEMCEKLRYSYHLNQVALSGGVFQNHFIVEGCINGLLKKGFKVYWQQQVPTNDGGISLGQCALAWVKLQKEER
ncbi:carbamoyltransferase HypF [Sporanaerobium hydrogeniformans]|uniref:Carbamoyltransferase HypF n=1 Tax=Sporanaerobium hydrogeniformans TaxID=3072179 RepID=A0AC61DFY5_9FIRM|nr:carbamoyltransferase HypF [Sporanaerobium hydrogeniformans]PHV71862.1 carbamoyltransferase HypF [Sporanaerobium hydrogeniformans]